MNIVVPSVVLTNCSKETGRFPLGPEKALLIAVSIPLIYGIYEFMKAKKVNAFSVLGLISVALTGGLGLLNTSAFWYACKEAAIPLILAIVVLVSHFKMNKPLSKVLLLNSEMFDIPRIESRIAEHSRQADFSRSIKTSTWLLAGVFLLSTALNFLLWIYLLSGKVPRSPEYMETIGRGNWMSYLVIGLPAMAMMVYAWFRLVGELERMTELKRDELLLPR